MRLVFMPLIDGYQLCRILKDDPATAALRSLLEAMGGRVGCSAAKPHGTIFWFELPITPGPGEPHET